MPLAQQGGTQLPCKDLLTNFELRNTLGRVRERWADGGNGALLIGLSVKVVQILKNSHDCLKAEPFLVISVSAHFVMTALRVKYIFCLSTNCYGPVSSSPKTSSLVFGAARTPTAAGAALAIQAREECSLWAHIHLELLAQLP